MLLESDSFSLNLTHCDDGRSILFTSSLGERLGNQNVRGALNTTVHMKGVSCQPNLLFVLTHMDSGILVPVFWCWLEGPVA